MKNLMQYFGHPCRSVIFTSDRLMNVQITEALRSEGILTFSTADTPANLALSLYQMSVERAVTLVVTLPRLTLIWKDPRAAQLIVVSRKWAKTDDEIKLLNQTRGRAPNARNAVHFEREADLYDETEKLPPFRFEELDAELQDLIYGYSFGPSPDMTAALRAADAIAKLAEDSKQTAEVFAEFGAATAKAHERFAEATALNPRTKSA